MILVKGDVTRIVSTCLDRRRSDRVVPLDSHETVERVGRKTVKDALLISISALLALGDVAPDFENLRGADGKDYSLSSFTDKPALVIIFSCNHCPYVQAYEDRMVSIQRDYASRGAQLVAINSNDERVSPGDNYPEMVKRAKARGFNFPYLRDADQKVVDAYGAVCTPHVFAFDAKRELRYRGRIDDSKDPSKVGVSDLRNALDEIIGGQRVKVPDTKPFGCSIKWLES